MFCGIDTDNGEVLTTYSLDTRADYSTGFLQRLPSWLGCVLLTALSSDVVRHLGFSIIGESKGMNLKLPHSNPSCRIPEEVFWGSKASYQGVTSA
jgi:hypothetical protein